jgi:hypothetical protein
MNRNTHYRSALALLASVWLLSSPEQSVAQPSQRFARDGDGRPGIPVGAGVPAGRADAGYRAARPLAPGRPPMAGSILARQWRTGGRCRRAGRTARCGAASRLRAQRLDLPFLCRARRRRLRHGGRCAPGWRGMRCATSRSIFSMRPKIGRGIISARAWCSTARAICTSRSATGARWNARSASTTMPAR